MNLMSFLSLLTPEVLLSAMLVLLLVMKIFSDNFSRSTVLIVISLFFLASAIITLIVQPVGSLFGGMFVVIPMIAIEKSILLFATFIISLLAFEWLLSYRNYLEFYLLLISIMLGMFIMISAGHFLSFYLGLEMATIPLAALSAFDIDKPRSGEAGMKLILSSAFSSGILLMGI